MAGVAYTQTALDRFYNHLAYKPWCGDDKAARLVRPKVSAVRKCYIAPNPPAMVYWLIFDIDVDLVSGYFWEDQNLPAPNIIVKNKNNDRQHLYYAITPVCITENARKKPIYYMKAIARGLGKALGADSSYAHRIAKNPMSDNWNVTELHAHEYSFDELADYAAPISEVFNPYKNNEEESEGRNTTLFNQLRFWAYAHVDHYRTHKNWSKWRKEVLNQALKLSTIQVDFGYNEIKHTAKSVAKWTWNKYFGSSVHRGVMELEGTDIPLEAKQRLAARRTHELRTSKTQEAIISAIKQAFREGVEVTRSLIALKVGISRQQISRRYAHLFTSEFLDSLKPRQDTDVIEKDRCNICCNQITAGVRGVNGKEGKVVYLASYSNRAGNVEKKDEGD